jgi:hypothetical protein
MPNIPAIDRLQKAARKVSDDFKGKFPSIREIKLDEVRGQPAVVVVATNATPPPGFPTALQLKNALGPDRHYNLRIVWRYAANPSDDMMWKGGSPVEDRLIRTISRGDGPSNSPLLNSSQKLPPQTQPDEGQVYLPMRKPAFADPSFWSQPFDVTGSVCVPNYNTIYTAYSFRVPTTRMVIINGISYQFDNSINLLEQFTVELMRTTDSLCTFYDMKASNAVDPAEQYAFAGHYRQMPTYCRFDHDETIIARVKVLGTYPFSHTDQDVLGGCFTINLHGWMSRLIDDRDGGARPWDLGEFNNMALGDV